MLGPTPLNTGAFVAVDIETTGCRPGSSSIIEIGAARIEHGTVTARFSTLVRPTSEIPASIVRLTGITAEMTDGAPSVCEAIASFREFAAGAVLIAHNHRFDMMFLDFEAERECGSPFPRPVLDTLSLARRLHPDIHRHNLRDLAVLYDAATTPNHRALSDACAAAEVFLAMQPELAALGAVTAADTARLCGVAERGSLAAKLSLATNLPDCPGVYLFRNICGQVIYVRKAKSLRARVRNHFYACDDAHLHTPASECASIEYVPLTSLLDAALLEVRLQDRYSPEFNRDGHRQHQPLYLHLDAAAQSPTVVVSPNTPGSGQWLGPLASRWATETIAAALSEHFGLAPFPAPAKPAETDPQEQTTAAREAYEAGVRAAISVLNGHGAEFRDVLSMMQERSARAEKFDDVARYRDAIRALDRTLGSLAVAHRAVAEKTTAIIEGDEMHVAVLLLVRGWLFTTLRFSRHDVLDGSYAAALERALANTMREAEAGSPVTPRRMRDMAIVDAYRKQHMPQSYVLGEDPAAASRIVGAAVRKLMRVPRKRHAAASGA